MATSELLQQQRLQAQLRQLILKLLYNPSTTRGSCCRISPLDHHDHDYLHYLEGNGDLVSRLITPISHMITPMIPIINLLA